MADGRVFQARRRVLPLSYATRASGGGIEPAIPATCFSSAAPALQKADRTWHPMSEVDAPLLAVSGHHRVGSLPNAIGEAIVSLAASQK